MIPDLTRGTIEPLLVDVEDFLGTLGDLTGPGTVFDVKTGNGAIMVSNAPVVINPLEPMRAQCLINTNVPTLWPAGKYYLYLKFVFATDAPILGDMEFHVNP